MQATLDLTRSAAYLRSFALTAHSKGAADRTLNVSGALIDFAHPRWQAKADRRPGHASAGAGDRLPQRAGRHRARRPDRGGTGGAVSRRRADSCGERLLRRARRGCDGESGWMRGSMPTRSSWSFHRSLRACARAGSLRARSHCNTGCPQFPEPLRCKLPGLHRPSNAFTFGRRQPAVKATRLARSRTRSGHHSC